MKAQQMTEKIDTPRTEESLIGPMHGDLAADLFVTADFARTLERELTEALKLIEHLNETWGRPR